MNTSRRRLWKYLRMAIEKAKECHNGSSWHFGGVLVKKNNVLSIGTNYPYKTHPKSLAPYKNIHCELDTILGVPKDKIEGATLYLARLGFDNRASLMMAKPCEDCLALLNHAKIRDVWFTANDIYVGHLNVRQNKTEYFSIAA